MGMLILSFVILIVACLFAEAIRMMRAGRRLAIIAGVAWLINRWWKRRNKPEPYSHPSQWTGDKTVPLPSTMITRADKLEPGAPLDTHPKCPMHNRSQFIQLDAQSYIMACATKTHDPYDGSPAYLVPDYDVCSWVSDEFRQVGDLIYIRPFKYGFTA